MDKEMYSNMIVMSACQFMNNFNRAMIALAEEFEFVSSSKQYISLTSEEEKVSKFFLSHVYLFHVRGWC